MKGDGPKLSLLPTPANRENRGPVMPAREPDHEATGRDRIGEECRRPAVPAVDVQGLVGCEGGLGGLVVSAGAGFRGLGLPNGPPSPRLALGGFY